MSNVCKTCHGGLVLGLVDTVHCARCNGHGVLEIERSKTVKAIVIPTFRPKKKPFDKKKWYQERKLEIKLRMARK